MERFKRPPQNKRGLLCSSQMLFLTLPERSENADFSRKHEKLHFFGTRFDLNFLGPGKPGLLQKKKTEKHVFS